MRLLIIVALAVASVLGWYAISAADDEKVVVAHTRWEYLTGVVLPPSVSVPPSQNPETRTGTQVEIKPEDVKELGREGWELFQVTARGDLWLYFFKRQLK